MSDKRDLPLFLNPSCWQKPREDFVVFSSGCRYGGGRGSGVGRGEGWKPWKWRSFEEETMINLNRSLTDVVNLEGSWQRLVSGQ